MSRENDIASLMLSWYDLNKRSFAFRDTGDPYLVWISEIMLQQTRTETAQGYFTRFATRFPNVSALAEAEEAEVLKYWEGLGYYSRARNLHKAARIVQIEHDGRFPDTYEAIRALPGIGDYTAAAISSIGYDLPYPSMDGNLNRVFSRLYDIHTDMDLAPSKQQLLSLAQQCMPLKRCGDFNQSLMDLGATICTPGTPDCVLCPLKNLCLAREQGTAELLPIHAKAKPPVPKDICVLLLRCKERIAVTKRTEKLLGGLWVFPLYEGLTPEASLRRLLPAKALIPEAQYLCSARHVFTHLIWNMKIWLVEIDHEIQSPELTWTDAEGLEKLALPGAMRAAKAEAQKQLNE